MNYYIGVGNFRVEQFCPTQEWLNWAGFAVSKEPKYFDNSGSIATSKIVVVLKSLDYPDFRTFTTFDLWKTPHISKAGNFCFLNPIGWNAWARDEDSLPSSFYSSCNGQFLKANEGELLLWDFFKVWLNGTEEGIDFNRDLWYEGNFNELNRRTVNSDVKLVGGSVVVETSKDKIKNKVYHKKFIPESETEHFRNVSYGKPYIHQLIIQDKKNKDKTTPVDERVQLSEHQKLIVAMNDPFFPCNDFFFNGYIKPYVPEENTVTSSGLLLK